VAELKTLMAPSPQQAARYLPSGEYLTANTSDVFSAIVMCCCRQKGVSAAETPRGARGAVDTCEEEEVALEVGEWITGGASEVFTGVGGRKEAMVAC
jgi:hypothetical protein